MIMYYKSDIDIYDNFTVKIKDTKISVVHIDDDYYDIELSEGNIFNVVVDYNEMRTLIKNIESISFCNDESCIYLYGPRPDDYEDNGWESSSNISVNMLKYDIILDYMKGEKNPVILLQLEEKGK